MLSKLCMSASLTAFIASASFAETTFSADGIYYKVLSTMPARVSVERGYGFNYSGTVDIPASVEYEGKDYSVTAIGRGAFYNSLDLTTVNIGPNVNEIGVSAFASCISLEAINVDAANTIYSSRDGVLFNDGGETLEKFPAAYPSSSYTIPEGVTGIQVQAFDYTRDLTSVTFPSTLQIIGAYAFMASSITEVNLPDAVDTLGEYAFYQCPMLTTVTLGTGITEISDFCFNSCSEIESVTLRGAVERIGDYAFFSCFKLAEFDLPQSLRAIGNGAFKSCETLRSVSIGKNVESIGLIPWSFCKALRSFSVEADNPVYASQGGVLFSKDGRTLIEYPAGRPGEYEIPETTTTIAKDAFYYCTRLTEISIPASVTSIEESAFHACTSLTSVSVPAAEIGSQAFMFCESLKSVTLGQQVQTIGTLAFSMCDGIKTISCLAAEPPVLASENIFSDTTYANASLTVGNAAKYKEAFGWKLFKKVTGTDAVDEFASDDTVVERIYISTDGKTSTAPMTPGIYLVRSSTADGKISIKKIIVK